MSPDGQLSIEKTELVEHDGHAIDVFRDWYVREDVASCAAVGATGLHADELVDPVVAGLPEDACLQAALPHVLGDGPVNLVSIGARGYAVLARSADGRFQFLQNDKCSSGTGETMVKIAGRFGLSIEEADTAALVADESIPITARCSVFAKSEMTHFGNQGRNADALFRGYFNSIGTYVSALLARTRVDGPVHVIGGCSRIRSLVAGLEQAAGTEVQISDHALYLEAIGALSLASEQVLSAGARALPDDPNTLIQVQARRFRNLDAPRDYADRVQRLEAKPVPAGAEREPSILGLD